MMEPCFLDRGIVFMDEHAVERWNAMIKAKEHS
jgi:hypothetical protein